MIFKDRAEAGERLAGILKNDPYIKQPPTRKKGVVISLLRGGIVLGDIIAKKLAIDHLPLAVAKIASPSNPELALGALCFDITYLDPKIVSSLSLDKASIQKQIKLAQEKFASYQKRFFLNEKMYNRLIDCLVILVDDGIATGSSVRAALLFVKSKKPKKIFLASPVAPVDFEEKGFDKVFIIHKDPYLSSVSQFYQNFPQVEDKEVEKMLY